MNMSQWLPGREENVPQVYKRPEMIIIIMKTASQVNKEKFLIKYKLKKTQSRGRDVWARTDFSFCANFNANIEHKLCKNRVKSKATFVLLKVSHLEKQLKYQQVYLLQIQRFENIQHPTSEIT